MKFIFQKTLNGPRKSYEGVLSYSVPAPRHGMATLYSPHRPPRAIAVHAGRCIQNRFQKNGESYPEISWKKLESKFHFARRKARRA